MKYILLIFSFISCIVNAQEIKVTNIRLLTPSDSGDYYISGISPDGKQLLVTRPKSKGLYLISSKSGEKRTITEMDGAGYEPLFSADGRYICFKSDEFLDKRRVSSLQKIDLNSGDTVILEKNIRNITRPASTGNSIVYLVNGSLQTRKIADKTLKSSEIETYVLLEDLTPVLYKSGVKQIFKPGGDGSYIWVSLSPDKTKMVYYLVGKGTFVSDLDGNVLASIAKLNAPKWLNNQLIIGMDDTDDGYRVITSELIAFSITTGKRFDLTSTNERNEMYPYPFPDGKRIAFKTSEGKLYIMNVKVK
jgi:Tol biopolymer transport system component